MKKSVLLSGIAIIGLLTSGGIALGYDCSYYQELISYYESSIQQYQSQAAGYSASIASQMSAQGLSSSAIASSTASNPYASTINELQGKLIQAKADYTNCIYSSSSSSSSSNYSYNSVMNSQKALSYAQKAIDYVEKEGNAYAKEDFENAVKYAEKAVENFKKASDYDDSREEYLFIEYGSLGWYYCLNSEYSKGKTYLKKSYNYTKDSDTKELYDSCLKLEKYDTSSTTTNTSTRPCSQYGPNSFLADDNLCYCKNGYTWNKAETTCVTLDESCRSYFGDHSIGDPTDLDNCLCEDGYEFNSDGSKCIKSSSNTNVVINNTSNGSNRSYNNEYSDEYNRAYEYAYANKITTMPTIEQANMHGYITRAEISKMFSEWALKHGATIDTSKSCKFNDISSVKGDLHDYIIKSCQLGIMGQGIKNFRPYDTISRAEVFTVISRILRGSTYEGCDPYYSCHESAIANAGIYSDMRESDRIQEFRGNVMMYLMRGDGVGESNSSYDDSLSCDDPVIALTCSVDIRDCPDACAGPYIDALVDEILGESSNS